MHVYFLPDKDVTVKKQSEMTTTSNPDELIDLTDHSTESCTAAKGSCSRVVNVHGINITEHDITTVEPKEMINDNIVAVLIK